MSPKNGIFALLWFFFGIVFTIVSWYMVPILINSTPSTLQPILWAFYIIILIFGVIVAPIAVAVGTEE